MNEMAHTPPQMPWTVPNPDGYSLVHIDVQVCQDRYGQTWSTHDLAAESDRATALTWPTGGLRQVAEALFVETIKREANLRVLRRMSTDPNFLTQLRGQPREAQESQISDMSNEFIEDMTRRLNTIVEPALWDALLEILESQ